MKCLITSYSKCKQEVCRSYEIKMSDLESEEKILIGVAYVFPNKKKILFDMEENFNLEIAQKEKVIEAIWKIEKQVIEKTGLNSETINID
ncbi:MAG: hypothetical protein E7311_03210 [Clostridiales bacterium]|nr:hypothetical protein [Clostridiales bacterium]